MPLRDADTLRRLAVEQLAELKGRIANLLLAPGSNRGHWDDAGRMAHTRPTPEADRSGQPPHATHATPPFLPPRRPYVNCLEPY